MLALSELIEEERNSPVSIFREMLRIFSYSFQAFRIPPTSDQNDFSLFLLRRSNFSKFASIGLMCSTF